MKTIRILTFHRVANNGAVLQNAALLAGMRAKFPACDVKTIDYMPWNMALTERLRACRPHRGKMLFGWRRHRVFQDAIERELALDKGWSGAASYESLVAQLDARNYDLLIAGSDCIWRISESFQFPRFPNIYWLSERIRAKKLAYAVSANKYSKALALTHRDTVKRLAEAYDALTVRDDDTEQLLASCGVSRPRFRMPDPAFMYAIGNTAAAAKMERAGLDLSRPVCGLLYHGAHPEVARIVELMRREGFQIAALGMFSPYADVNLGDALDPFEWAEAFKYLRFCVTDRFHGTVFCLKNETRFIAIETSALPAERCKKWQLLSEFGLEGMYLNLHAATYELAHFERCFRMVEETWGDIRLAKIRNGLARVEAQRAALDAPIEALLK